MRYDVIVIGAGWAGLTAADRLNERGLRTLVLEKSRGPGGRSSTRRQDGASFDHGAQYFSARTAPFARVLQQWQDAGWVERWTPRLAVLGDPKGHSDPNRTRRFVAVPGMNGVCRQLADALDCRYQVKVNQIQHDQLWRVGLEGVDEVLQSRFLLLTAPPAQTAALLGADHLWHQDLLNVKLRPSIATMVSFAAPFDPGFDAAFVNLDNPLSWIANNSSKPQRKGGNWVLHATPEWSETHLELPLDELAKRLLSAFRESIALPIPEPVICRAHRWRYALGHIEPLHGCMSCAAQGLAIAGDWLAGSRIEGAWISGDQAARWILDQ